MNFETGIKIDIRDFLLNYKGVQEFHLEIKRPNNGVWNTRSTIVIRLWLNQVAFDSQEIANLLVGEKSFEDKIKELCKGVVVPKFDIYYR